MPDDHGRQADRGHGNLGRAEGESRGLRAIGTRKIERSGQPLRSADSWPRRSPGTRIPRNVSDSAFRQLVDGDAKDLNPAHKPKDGDFTGPIQIGEMAWIILRRESVVPKTPGVSLDDPQIKKQTYEVIYEVKLKETMNQVFQELIKQAGIENKLTGTIKMANEEQDPDFKQAKTDIDGQVKLMSNPPSTRPAGADSGITSPTGSGSTSRSRGSLPTALSAEAAEQDANLQRPLKSGTGAGSPNGSTAGSSNN